VRYYGHWWNDTDRRKPKCSEKNISPFQLSTIDLTWKDMLSNPGLHSEKSATKRLKKPKYSEKNMSQYHFSTIDFTRTDLLPNPGLRSENFAINCRSKGTAVIWKRTSEDFTDKLKI
jgi:hypothetical protein